VLPAFTSDGLLPPGVYPATWRDLMERFGNNARRRSIFEGIRRAADVLASAGCSRIWVDGSFVTAKESPGDWDGCWDPVGVDPARLDPSFLDASWIGRNQMKTKYLADLFPASIRLKDKTLVMVDFFSVDKLSGVPKGIVLLALTGSTL
jgi:hypothetical protein